MRIDKLTSKFQLALSDAQSLAVGQDHQLIEPAHVMVALLDQQGGSVRGLLTKSGVNVNLLRSQLGDALDRLPTIEGAAGDVQISHDLGRHLNLMDKLAQDRQDQFISSELFVLAALDAGGTVADLLTANGATRPAVEQAIEQMRGGESVADPNAELDGVGKGIWNVSVVALMQELVGAIREGRPLNEGATFADGLACQRVMDAVLRSSRERRWIEL